jgi:TonB family protein
MLACAFAASGAASLAQGAPATSPPVVEHELIGSDPSCVGSPSSPIDFTEAFATRISSSQVLRFIAFLDRLPESDQMRVVAAIDALPKSRVQSQAERDCRTVAGVATMRALYLIANRWRVSLGGPGDVVFATFTRAVEAAIVTLLDDSAAKNPTPSSDPSTLAPFAYAPARSAGPTPATSPCTLADEDARTTDVVSAVYPEIARANRTQGQVMVVVHLNDQGLVENTTLSRSSATGLVGGSALGEAEIVAVYGSRFVPARIGCVTRPGKYLFRVDFKGR